jgi:hypothetical protein
MEIVWTSTAGGASRRSPGKSDVRSTGVAGQAQGEVLIGGQLLRGQVRDLGGPRGCSSSRWAACGRCRRLRRHRRDRRTLRTGRPPGNDPMDVPPVQLSNGSCVTPSGPRGPLRAAPHRSPADLDHIRYRRSRCGVTSPTAGNGIRSGSRVWAPRRRRRSRPRCQVPTLGQPGPRNTARAPGDRAASRSGSARYRRASSAPSRLRSGLRAAGTKGHLHMIAA